MKERSLPEDAHLCADSFYQAYGKDHRNFDHPDKKPKGGELSDEDKEYNRGLSSFRVRARS